MRLVDADALMESLKESADRAKEWYEDCKTYNSAMIDRAKQTIMTLNECGLRIKEAPTVDAVPVVRCKDCRYWDVSPASTAAPAYHECKARASRIGRVHTTAEEFCSRGERKDGDNHEG